MNYVRIPRMNRTEALHILGLEDGASADDIKIAYRETVQILHPDKFAGNDKLQNRATEQFKRLQEAYDLLMASGSGGRGSGARAGRSSAGSAATGGSPARSWSTSATWCRTSAATALSWRRWALWPRC